jgi:transcriptional regulator of acetoin/glycerol metabolism
MATNAESGAGTGTLGALLSAVIDALGETVVVLDRDGQVAYASEALRPSVQGWRERGISGADLVAELVKLGGLRVRLPLGQGVMGEAVLLRSSGDNTLAERERRAILETLGQTGWQLAAAARHLGISRTTLWRRLKEYGVQRDRR